MTIVAISGYGKVGHFVLDAALNDAEIEVRGIIEKQGHPLVGSQQKGIKVTDDIGTLGKVEVLIEFSVPEAVMEHLQWAAENRVAMLIATTGLTEEQKAKLQEAAKEIPVLLTSNVTLGMSSLFNLLPKLAKALIPAGWVYDITEVHRKLKKDKPSGTALTAERKIKEATGQGAEEIHSIRAGNVVGIHEFKFFGPSGESIEVIHRVTSREDFALAAVSLAKLLNGMPVGFYDVPDLIAES